MSEILYEISLKVRILQYFSKFLVLGVTLIAGSAQLSAANLVACYDGTNGDPTILRVAPCANQVSFSNFTSQFIDWGVLGTSLGNTYDPAANSNTAWQVVSSSGITVGLNTGPGFTGNPTLERVDNGYLYDLGESWIPIPVSQASMFDGHFNSIPNAGSGAPYGDHLVGFGSAQGPLLIQFSAPVSAVGFYISSKVLLGVDATIKAYTTLNPTTSDIPFVSYRVTDTGGGGAGGSCPGLYQSPPVPCNDAPFLAVNSALPQIRSVVITSSDTSGFYIDSLYFGAEQVPEPATGLLIGIGLVALSIRSKKIPVMRIINICFQRKFFN